MMSVIGMVLWFCGLIIICTVFHNRYKSIEAYIITLQVFWIILEIWKQYILKLLKSEDTFEQLRLTEEDDEEDNDFVNNDDFKLDDDAENLNL